MVTKECLQYTKGLTVALQKRSIDIYQATREVNTVVATLQDVREHIDVKHKTWCETAVSLGQKVRAPEPQQSDAAQYKQPEVTCQEILLKSTTVGSFPFLFLMSSSLI